MVVFLVDTKRSGQLIRQLFISFQERLSVELGRAAFGEDRQRSFKIVLDCFERIGEERFAISTFLDFEHSCETGP